MRLEPRTSWAVYITNTVWNNASLEPSGVSAEDSSSVTVEVFLCSNPSLQPDEIPHGPAYEVTGFEVNSCIAILFYSSSS